MNYKLQNFLIFRLAVLALFSAVLLVSGESLANFSQDKGEEEEVERKRVVFFGDSIVSGYGLKDESETLSAQFQKLSAEKGYDIDVINSGITNETSLSALRRVEWLVKRYKPNVVVIILGKNDIKQGMKASATKKNLRNIVKYLKANNARVMLMGIQAPLYNGIKYKREFDAIYQHLKSSYNVSLYPNLFAGIQGRSQYMQKDGEHPNKEGYAYINKRISPSILKYLDWLYKLEDR